MSRSWQHALEQAQQAFHGEAAGQPADAYVCISTQDANRFLVCAHGEWNEHMETEEDVNAFLLAHGINPQTHWRRQW